jgi:hypothetical protein
MPQTVDDPVPELEGDRDVSVPVREIAPHMDGSENDWLFGDGGFPWAPEGRWMGVLPT